VYARRRYISYTFNKQDIASAYLRTGRQGPRGDVNPLAGQLPPTVVIPFGNSSRRGRRLGRRSTQITFLLDTNYFNIDLYCHHRTTQGVP